MHIVFENIRNLWIMVTVMVVVVTVMMVMMVVMVVVVLLVVLVMVMVMVMVMETFLDLGCGFRDAGTSFSQNSVAARGHFH